MANEQPKVLEGQKVLLELRDPLGHMVYLFETRWLAKIVLDHPVTLEDVGMTISDPNAIIEFGGDRRYYRMRPNKQGYMFVVTRSYRGYNSVVTTYPVDKIQDWKGAIIVHFRRS